MAAVSASDTNAAIAQRIGVIGGGQLAWMMAEASHALDIHLLVQTPHPSDPAVQEASGVVLADVQDAQATAQLAAQCDVITFENEFVDLPALSTLEQAGTRFFPKLTTLSPLLDKFDQRSHLAALGLPTPRFTTLDPGQDANHVLQTWSFPLVLKARRHGYDGQGTFIITDAQMLEDIRAKLGDQSVLIEEFVPFTCELAVMVARSQTGDIAVFPVVETQQKHQVCRWVLAPADLPPQTLEAVTDIARRWICDLDGVGMFGIELFLTANGDVLVNEIAPRTHNSGHYTIEACYTSQFEQQLRAVSGLPLGNPNLKVPAAVMVNLLGYETADSDYADKRARLSAFPNAYVHWYGKTQSRPGRKLGHVTVICPTVQSRSQLLEITQALEDIWYEC